MTEKNQERIRQAFENKEWPEIKSSDSWNIFKVMAEFVDGYDTPNLTVWSKAKNTL